MKTPREILLARHRAVEPKLDKIRRAVARELNNEATKEQSPPASLVSRFLCCSQQIWNELIWPCRRTWAGLAAVWLAIALFHLSQRELRQPALAQTAPSPGETRLAWLEQRRVLDELIGPMPAAPAAEPPRRPNNQPRSERRAVAMA